MLLLSNQVPLVVVRTFDVNDAISVATSFAAVAQIKSSRRIGMAMLLFLIQESEVKEHACTHRYCDQSREWNSCRLDHIILRSECLEDKHRCIRRGSKYEVHEVVLIDLSPNPGFCRREIAVQLGEREDKYDGVEGYR